MTPLAALHHQVANHPDGVAFVDGHGRWSYARFAEQAARVARGLLDRGIRSGDRIVLHMPNGGDLAVALYACFHIGAIAVPMNVRLKTAELAPLLARLRPALYIGHASLRAVVEGVDAAVLPLDDRLVAGDGRSRHAFENLAGEPGAVTSVTGEHAHAVLIGTSGTTGVPKFVVHTGATLAATTEMTADWGLRDAQRALVALPMVHISGLCAFMTCIRLGVAMVLVERFDPEVVLDAVETHRCDWLGSAPFLYDGFVKAQAGRPRNTRSLRFCVTGGDVCPLRVQTAFARVFGVALASVWGATEAVGSLTWGLVPGPVTRIGAGAEVLLADDAGRPVPPGAVGELLVRGPNVTIGYWAGPGVIEGAPANGWWHSGDMMRQDGDGNLWFVSRKKDLIVRGGSNISPVEVEHVLIAHPAVADAAVVGVPDDVLGQRVAGFVQLKDGVSADAVAGVLDDARGRLADYKVPERLVAVAAIPRNALGKADRGALAAMLLERPVVRIAMGADA